MTRRTSVPTGAAVVWPSSRVAELLGVKPATLRVWRHRGRIPPLDYVGRHGGGWSAETLDPWLADLAACTQRIPNPTQRTNNKSQRTPNGAGEGGETPGAL